MRKEDYSPDKHVVLDISLEKAEIVDKEIGKRFEEVRDRIRELDVQLRMREIAPEAAKDELARLTKELAELRGIAEEKSQTVWLNRKVERKFERDIDSQEKSHILLHIDRANVIKAWEGRTVKLKGMNIAYGETEEIAQERLVKLDALPTTFDPDQLDLPSRMSQEIRKALGDVRPQDMLGVKSTWSNKEWTDEIGRIDAFVGRLDTVHTGMQGFPAGDICLDEIWIPRDKDVSIIASGVRDWQNPERRSIRDISGSVHLFTDGLNARFERIGKDVVIRCRYIGGSFWSFAEGRGYGAANKAGKIEVLDVNGTVDFEVNYMDMELTDVRCVRGENRYGDTKLSIHDVRPEDRYVLKSTSGNITVHISESALHQINLRARTHCGFIDFKNLRKMDRDLDRHSDREHLCVRTGFAGRKRERINIHTIAGKIKLSSRIG